MSHLRRSNLSSHTSSAFDTALLSKSWPLTKTLTCYPSSLFPCLYNSRLAHYDSCQTLLIGSSLKLLNNPLPTSLILFYSPNSSDTSSLTSHLSPSSSSNGQQYPYSFAFFASLKNSPCQPWHSLFLNPAFPT